MIQEHKVITKYIADTEQEKRAIDDLISRVNKLKATESAAAQSREQHFDQLVLDLTRTNNGVEEMNTNWGEAAKKSFSFGETMQGVAKTLAPWNQALELAGKAVRFMDESMEAAGKKYPQYADDVRAVTKEFKDLKESVMAASGVIIVEMAKALPSIDQIKKHTEDLQRQWMSLLTTGHSGADPYGAITGAWGNLKEALKSNVDYWNNDGEAFIDKFVAGMKKVGKAKQELTFGMFANVGQTDYDFDWYGKTTSPGSAASMNAQGFAIDEQKLLEQITAGMDLRSVDEQYRSFNAQQSNSKLEQMFGPIDEFNAYQEAFNMLGGAVTSAMDAWIDGSMSAGEAVKKFIGQALKALASQMAIESLKHGAYALGSLAFGDVRGAGQHAAAAAAFGVGAAAAAVAAKSMGGGAAPTSAGASAGGSAGGGSSFAGTAQQGTGERIIVVMGDSFSRSSPRMQQLDAERTVDLAFGGNGVASR